MTVTRVWKVYGLDGEPQQESFRKSEVSVYSTSDKTRIINVANSDITGTNEYSVIAITRDSADECEDEFWGQVSDGVFENCFVGKTEEITLEQGCKEVGAL